MFNAAPLLLIVNILFHALVGRHRQSDTVDDSWQLADNMCQNSKFFDRISIYLHTIYDMINETCLQCCLVCDLVTILSIQLDVV